MIKEPFCLQAYHGFESHPLRQCPLSELSLPPRRGHKKPNNGGHFAPDLLTRFVVSEAIWLSLRPFLSKAVDCRI
jgi:hypothetical protein